MTEPDTNDPEPGPDRVDLDIRSALTGLVFGGLFLLILEYGWSIIGGRIRVVEASVPLFLTATAAMTIGLWLVHAIPVWGLYELGRRYVAKTTVLLPGFAALFGVSWQHTLVQGDGIGAHPLFPAIRILFLVGVPIVCGALTWAMLTPKFDKTHRRIGAAVFLVGGVVFNMQVLIGYQSFHGHLAAFNAAIFIGLLYPIWRHPAAKKAAAAIFGIFVVSAAATIPDQEDARTNIQRFAHLPACLSAGLPAGSVLRVEPDKIFTVEKASSEDLQEYYELFFEDDRKFEASSPQGDNVLVVVIESVRADYWDDPELTPEFHDWKDRGVYFPNAIANYPATPLAYGAMFAAQPPSVLAQTPYWSENRLFDGIKDDFDELHFSQPDEPWFEHTAISDFLLPREVEVHGHETAPEGLDYVRDNLSGLDEDENFFSFVHLYEPHAPYEAREPWAEGRTDDRAAYRSEISYIDKHLGKFIDWFYDQPMADDTLLVMVSDHGQGMGEEIMGDSFWGHHVHVHNVVSNIPIFVAGPGLPEQTREEEIQAMQMDVMPTIYEFTGHAMPRQLMPQGNSVYHLLDERPTRPLVTEAFSIRGHQFFDFLADAGDVETDELDELRQEFHEISTDGHGYSPKIAIQHGDYKLIRDRLLETDWLYNVAEDPHEQRDLYNEKPDKADKMSDRLEQWNTLQGEVVRRLDEVLQEDVIEE